MTERYPSRRPRPIAQLLMRVGLWGAVLLGCVGGAASMLRSPASEAQPVAAPSDDGVDVPAPVARLAELVAAEWLTATPDDEDRLADLFLDPPSLDQTATDTLAVGEVTAIAGRPLQDRYWVVTVEAEVTETVPVAPSEADPAADENSDPAAPAAPEQRMARWYLDVPIAGNVDSGLVALTTPALLPQRPVASTGWRPSVDDPVAPADDDPTVETVRGFLEALLAGSGDPERYVAPGLDLVPAEPAPFAAVDVVSLAVDQLLDDQYRVLANVSALTAGGYRQSFAYELVVVERVDRLEVVQFSGAPTMVAGSADPPADQPADQSAEADAVPEAESESQSEEEGS